MIADRPLTDIVPVQLVEDRGAGDEDGERSYKIVTQYSMKPIEEIGLLKMDFLGPAQPRRDRGLPGHHRGVHRASARHGGLPLDDPTTYAMMAAGNSIGVFQFESDGMRDALRKVKPTEFEDLVALVALYRPGRDAPHRHLRAQQAQPRRRHYFDERLRPITEATYGVILYQEQSMQIAKAIAGFSGAEADDLRKAIGKKNREAMAALRERFFEGARASGTSEAVIQELWAVNEAAADYSFNRAPQATRVILPDGKRIRLVRGLPPPACPRSCRCGPTATIRPHKVREDRPHRAQARLPRSLRERPSDHERR